MVLNDNVVLGEYKYKHAGLMISESAFFSEASWAHWGNIHICQLYNIVIPQYKIL